MASACARLGPLQPSKSASAGLRFRARACFSVDHPEMLSEKRSALLRKPDLAQASLEEQTSKHRSLCSQAHANSTPHDKVLTHHVVLLEPHREEGVVGMCLAAHKDGHLLVCSSKLACTRSYLRNGARVKGRVWMVVATHI
mmetsp:Transcript_26048/g.52225  ORF Transcript_26048/g.52225 Transcript_26048/m.52225 type:complete len:141 (+) Transcript_26048:679-1101(+)